MVAFKQRFPIMTPFMHWKKHLCWLAPVLLLDGLGLWFYLRWIETRPAARAPESEALELDQAPAGAVVPQLRKMVFPTGQTGLLDPAAANVFQPTASGRPESALYGSTRTGRRGKLLRATFHEGIDVAAVRRDRRGWPLDEIYAVADGQAAYINRTGGNSNYGKYVVLKHADPLGEIYSLYAHLASVAAGLRAGQAVSAGETLGVMGNTSTSPIPMAQAHLHLEIGLILNNRFRAWYRRQNLKPDHGNFHGWNLLGLDPLGVFAAQRQTPDFSLLAHLAAVAPAFEAVLATRILPDFFRRYPKLWRGAPFAPPAIAVVCSENGVPLSGRNAGAGEQAALGGGRWLVQNVNPAGLGRNGTRLIRENNGGWQLADNGEKWRDMLLYQ